MSVIIGLDIGGTNVRIGVGSGVGAEFSLLAKATMPLPRLETAAAEIDRIIAEIGDLLRATGLQLTADSKVGVSLAAVFSRETGQIQKWPNHPQWNGFPFKSYLEGKLGAGVIMEDDANCAALAELAQGLGQKEQNFLYLTISTGIGSGLILDGKLYRGVHGWAGEAGHLVVAKDGPLCVCGRRGCIQALAAGPAILRRALELAHNAGLQPGAELDLKDVVNKAREGVEWAHLAFEEAGRDLAIFLANLVLLLDIPLIILGGGVCNAGAVLMDPLQKQLAEELAPAGRAVQLRLSELDADNGLFGALYLANTGGGRADGR